tara:strand:- start:26046 stop:26552 length:507 start_codon:yes stop_codon:yes gene_type:complete
MSDRAPKEPKTSWDFIAHCAIVCPKCSRRAIVRRDAATDSARLTCGRCAHVRQWQGPARSYLFGWRKGQDLQGAVVLGAPIDPYFHRDLWLRISCVGELLWAYNHEHLAFLHAYIAAPLRERPREPKEGWGYRNLLLESRLPKWMTSAKHRDAVLAGVAKLQRRLLEE